jgi:transposase InsO family protein
LREEGYQVGLTMIHEYLRERRRQRAEVYVPLVNRPGEAQIDFIEGWYNPHRRHSALDYLSPINYERSHSAEADFRSPTPSTETG